MAKKSGWQLFLNLLFNIFFEKVNPSTVKNISKIKVINFR